MLSFLLSRLSRRYPLYRILAQEIKLHGPITIERFMQIVLQHPVHGYYRTGNPIGRDGDFVTSPEISQIFGEMVAVWCVRKWIQLGRPDSFLLLEMGPGRGTLMQDILLATQSVEGFLEAKKLYLFESNDRLRKSQNEKLRLHSPTHVSCLADLPSEPLLVVANEFFDTMPMRQFVKTSDGWRERLVDFDGKKLFLTLSDQNREPEDFQQDTSAHHWCDGAFYETSPLSRTFMSEIATHIHHNGGAGLFIDYGYIAPAGRNSLVAIRNHSFYDDLFITPGQADVTADVNFAALQNVAAAKGVNVEGLWTQAGFLNEMGIAQRIDLIKQQASPLSVPSLDEDVNRLMNSCHMGADFKVLAIGKNRSPQQASA